MCIVIDACALSHVFKVSDAKHPDFEPVKNWIQEGDGKVVFGGTKYIKEMQLAGYRKLFVELKKQHNVVIIDKAAVDAEEVRVKDLYSHRDFDDAHLIAIIRCSRCRLVCTSENRAIPFLKNQVPNIDFYEKKAKPPRIYKNKRHCHHLLCNQFIAAICR